MLYDADIMIIGCGNVLFKDDGFGPGVIQEMERINKEYPLPDGIQLVDGGTSAPHYVFSLPNPRWKKMILIDIMDINEEPGTLKLLDIDETPKGKYDDPHSIGVTDPFDDFKNHCEIKVLVCQPETVSSPYVELGLTDKVKNAISEAITMVYDELKLEKPEIKLEEKEYEF
ncbi:MAG: coenzyme F420-reducing hydrogenase, FrhD protein [Methanobacteriaceae archaeon]|nr:coenzyme F420-reducing hydrogenase, FrhD protein [Methanobacteriaceae archaeon]